MGVPQQTKTAYKFYTTSTTKYYQMILNYISYVFIPVYLQVLISNFCKVLCLWKLRIKFFEKLIAVQSDSHCQRSVMLKILNVRRISMILIIFCLFFRNSIGEILEEF